MRGKRALLTVVAALSAALAVLSGVMLYRSYADSRRSAESFAELAEMVSSAPAPPQTPEPAEKAPENAPPAGDEAEPAVEPEPEPEPEPLTAYEKYAAVLAENADFVGWLRIDGTGINFPVMQTPDRPDYYLKRGFDRSYSSHGVPYMEEACRAGESDNCVIYGHNMRDGTMFADLCRYESRDFWQEHPMICFDTTESFGEYEVMYVFKTTAYTEDSFQYYLFTDAENAEEYDAFLRQCAELSLYDTGVTAAYGDRLLTLSTCEYSRTDGRMVVVAKRAYPAE